MNTGLILAAPAAVPPAPSTAQAEQPAKGFKQHFAASLGAAGSGRQTQQVTSGTPSAGKADAADGQTDPLQLLQQVIMQLAANGMIPVQQLPQNQPGTLTAEQSQQGTGQGNQATGDLGAMSLQNALFDRKAGQESQTGQAKPAADTSAGLFTVPTDTATPPETLFPAVGKTDAAGKDAIHLQFKAVEAEADTASAPELKATSGGRSSDASLKDVSAAMAFHQQGQSLSSQRVDAPVETLHVSRLTEVSESVAKALGSGEQQLTIRIDPPDMGSITIKLITDNGVLKAEVKVDSSSVKDMFAVAMPQIRATLEQAGIKVGDFHVDLKDDRQPAEQGSREQQQQRQEQPKNEKQNFSDFFA